MSVIGGPLTVLVYFRLFTLPWVGAMLALGCCLALTMAFLTRAEPDVSPPLSMGSSLPLGAALLAAFGFVIAAMWIDR